MNNIQNHNTDCFFFTNVQEKAEAKQLTSEVQNDREHDQTP